MNAHALWYATRGTGVVSLVLLTAVVCLGVAGSRRLSGERRPRFLVAGLHRNLTLLTLVFLGLHVVTTVLDGFAPIRLLDAVLPFAAAYRPVWLGLGAVAFDLLLALTVTSLFRARVGYRSWRTLHWLAYVSWPVALVHALGTGSDARVSWLQGLAVLAALAVAAAVLVRLRHANSTSTRRVAAGAATLLVALSALVWYRNGPGQRGWAARAGTPASLLAAAPVRSLPAARRSVVAPALPSPPYTTTLRGKLSESQSGDGLVLVDIRGRTSIRAGGALWIRLQGTPTGDGGVEMTASGASYGPASAPDEYVGKIVALAGTRMVLDLRRASGGSLALTLDLRIDQVTDRVSGTVVAEPAAGETE